MKICIFVDMEGISGISGSEFVTTGSHLHSEGRLYYTQDVNACVQGCFDAGAEGVLVRDGHGSGNHILTDKLDQRAELIQGHTDRRFPFLDEFDAIILLGYHAMAGTPGALLEHTYSSATVQNLWLNDRKIGEIGIDAVVAGELGKPIIMVSGDDKACAEAADWIPGVVTCQVKTGITCQSARLLPLEKAHELIRTKAVEAINKMNDIAPVVPAKPAVMRLEMMERIPVRNAMSRPDYKVLDARTCEVTADTVEEAFYALF